MTTTEHQPITSEEIGGIGHSIRRVEDDRFIEGAGNYLGDVNLPGMLHMAILRSPLAHAKILSIDSTAATDHPGVVAVITGADLEGFNLAWMPTLSGDTQAVLATDKVRFQGQEVAAVIAEDPYIAEDALSLIVVDYEELPVITNPEQSMAEGAPVIRDDKEGQTDNSVYHWEAGDKDLTDRAFADADVVVSPRDALSQISPGSPRDMRGCRGHQSGYGSCNDLPDVAGATRTQNAVRSRRRAARTQDPHHLPRPRRRIRQQGSLSTRRT